MKTFEKVMTREVPLVIVEAWSAVFTESIPRAFGFPWPAPIFISRNGVVESWRPTQLFHEMLPKKVARWLCRLPRNRQRLIHAFKGYQQYAKQIHRMHLVNPKHKKTRDSIREITYVTRAFTNGCAGLIPAFWLAEWNNRAVTAGKKPLFDAIVLAKAELIRSADTLMDDCTDLIDARLRTVAQQELLPPVFVNCMLLAELKNVLQGKHDVHTIAKRRQGYTYFQGKLLLLDALPAFLRRHGYCLKEPRTKSATHIIGTVAHSGTARGMVKVVCKRAELIKVEQGDILMAPMTTPWYLPAMRKAAAIVTDEGGITCHAAIVSRELKKPCIIGTKSATKIFKDGDRVEVDAIKGIVRKV